MAVSSISSDQFYNTLHETLCWLPFVCVFLYNSYFLQDVVFISLLDALAGRAEQPDYASLFAAGTIHSTRLNRKA